MSEPEDDGRRLLLMVLLALWAAAWGLSVLQLLATPEGAGFTRGLNRVSGFLGWQAIAGLVALALWGVGRGFPKGSGTRRISGVPLGTALALLLAYGGGWLWLAANG